MRKILLSTVALAAMAGTAFAADLPSTKSAPVYMAPAPVFSWTGFYAGVEGGADFLNTKYSAINRSNHMTSGLLGGVVGYNYQVNQFVLGLEGNADGVLGGARTLTVGTNSVRTSQDFNGDIRGRVGIAYDRALFYAAGGVAFGQVKSSYYTPAFLGSSNMDRTGWTIGAGVDYAITPNWVGRVEYRYTDLGSSYTNVAATRVSNTSNAVLIGLMYKFGTPEVLAAKY